MTSWLTTIKPGDKAIISMREQDIIDIVDRLTATQVIMKNSKRRFRLSDGGLVGGTIWNSARLEEPMPERVYEITQKRLHALLVQKIGKADLSNVSVDKLKDILDIVVTANTPPSTLPKP